MDILEADYLIQSDSPTDREAMVSSEVFENADLVDAIFRFIEQEFPALAPRTAHLKEEVRREFSGEKVWIPRRSQAERDRLAKDVLSSFNGRNATEVARRLNIGRATVYRIIKQAADKK
jgi:Mor family transcriptional regulator